MSEVNQKKLGRVLHMEGTADTEDSMFPMQGSQVRSLVGVVMCIFSMEHSFIFLWLKFYKKIESIAFHKYTELGS